jgi:L-alanine-DL-glutamate epimerase-like enolase superfamily enzyme
MRIESVVTTRLSVPMRQPMRTAIHSTASTENVLIEVIADGLIGQGCALTLSRGQADAVRSIGDDLGQALVGRDALDINALWHSMLNHLNLTGTSGIGVLALSALDTALWDLLGQRAQLPLSVLLGRAHTRLPVYAQGGWLSYSVTELLDEAVAFERAGYQHYKMRVGSTDWRSDVRRVEAVVNAVGASFHILLDANQGWRRDEAIQAARALDGLGLFWLEEPVDANDLEGSALIAAAITTPICVGETIFGTAGFTQAIRSRAADIFMLDLQHCAGPTGFMRVAALAEAAYIPVSSHLFTEVSVHLLAACESAVILEYMPGWWDELFESKADIRDGFIDVPSKPGIGYRIGEAAKRRFSTT